ncbi:hypothetical protein FGO68_gene12883 [Halteria grandinella]|uniref:Cyclic nucleotide-binding domain-containing protein n=1 Tax=Halteria grandinella TaxID=5974 RepID=A0A8J8T3L4_HALGN|nr:hypothetical protein FGO68_gene12883 [Halteria grandinella]
MQDKEEQLLGEDNELCLPPKLKGLVPILVIGQLILSIAALYNFKAIALSLLPTILLLAIHHRESGPLILSWDLAKNLFFTSLALEIADPSLLLLVSFNILLHKYQQHKIKINVIQILFAICAHNYLLVLIILLNQIQSKNYQFSEQSEKLSQRLGGLSSELNMEIERDKGDREQVTKDFRESKAFIEVIHPAIRRAIEMQLGQIVIPIGVRKHVQGKATIGFAEKGEVIVREGDKTEKVMWVSNGRCKAIKERYPSWYENIIPAQSFGGESVIYDCESRYSVVAEEHTVCLQIGKEDLQTCMKEHPELCKMMCAEAIKDPEVQFLKEMLNQVQIPAQISYSMLRACYNRGERLQISSSNLIIIEQGSLQISMAFQKPEKLELPILLLRPGYIFYSGNHLLKQFKLKPTTDTVVIHHGSFIQQNEIQQLQIFPQNGLLKWKLSVLTLILQKRKLQNEKWQLLAQQKLKNLREKRKKEGLMKGLLNLTQRMQRSEQTIMGVERDFRQHFKVRNDLVPRQ